MSYYRPHSARLLVCAILLGVLIGIAAVWGEDLIALVAGQDILEDLQAELTQPTPTSEAALQQSAVEGTPVQPVVVAPQESGADGFPLVYRRHVLKYTVQPGDTLFAIAERFGIHPNTIFWANTETLQDDVNLLYAGTELYILPVDGVYHTANGSESIAAIAAQYGVAPGDILYSEFNALSTYDSSYVPPAGLRIVVPGGRREFISWRSPIRTGSETGRANPEGSLHPGSCRQIYSGAGGMGNYINPLGDIPYRITQDFAPWHPGVDLAADLNTPIYAAETGIVVFAGWHSGGYGELVILDHGNGWTTYYGHLAARYVDCGDQVAKGQHIGDMGMSGNASGIHLHFEIRQNDIAQNPARYIRLSDVRTAQEG